MLRSLELFGFKSFADKTVFDFSAGLTGVVGPNGSGKSNVVDSIKWLLGDQSPRSLRGKEMTDVIFNGSSSRGGSQFAEATLVFDNRTRFLPVEMDEVSVGRRLWQSGDSEYLINRNTARLKDVRELFRGPEPVHRPTASSNRAASTRFCSQTLPIVGSFLKKLPALRDSSRRKLKPHGGLIESNRICFA